MLGSRRKFTGLNNHIIEQQIFQTNKVVISRSIDERKLTEWNRGNTIVHYENQDEVTVV